MTTCFRRLVLRLSLASVCWSGSALAADVLNSNARPDADARPPITSQPDSKDRDEEPEHTETNVVPVVGGSTDLGIGGGYFAGIARVKKGKDPYLWNIDSAGLVTFKFSERAGFTVPYQDWFARVTVPRLFGSALRLEIRPSYTWESVNYYGMGNASKRDDHNPNPDYAKYDRGHPQFDIDVRGRIVDHLAVRVGFRYTRNFVDVPADSKLDEDLRTGSAEVKRLIGDTSSHAVMLFKYGVLWDTRDNETSSHSGSFDTFDLKLSPGGTSEFPSRYGEATVNLRAFVPLGTKRVSLAMRAVGDWMFGDVPFYELARYDDSFAIGGSKGVRGVPAQRYYGKIKAFGNIELRMEVLPFRAFGKQLMLAVVPFFDGGRVWADTHSHPELDGRGLGLKWGAGGGLRLQSGGSFVIKLDVAGSPDATPVSGYFAAGQTF